MKYNFKRISIPFFALLCLLPAMWSCDNDKTVMRVNSLDFTAVNLTTDPDGKQKANGSGGVVTVTVSVEVIVNGESTTMSVTCKSNELPVFAGNEIEVTFLPSSQHETEAFFLMPDGTSQKVTASSPSFIWLVPENIEEGMEITGESRYETDDVIYVYTGAIKLIPLKP